MTDAIAKKQESALGIPSKDFLKEYSPIAVPAKTAAIRSPVEAAASNMPTLSQIKKHFGEKMTVFYLTTWLDNLTAYLGKKYELSEPQTVETATLILQRYPHLNIADLKMVFDSIKTGDCGVTLYGDINGLTIIKIFDAYSETRSRLCYEKNLQRDDVIKKHGYDKTEEHTSEQQVADLYAKYRIKYEEKKEREHQIHLSNQAHLVIVATKANKYLKKK
ncbi:MAG: hypothetical protein IKP73_06015 [Bacteroidales bacterium]|nr:hypothetical protein [Bacteroidales bacterium]